MVYRNYKYNWSSIQKDYDAGLSYRDLFKKHGVSFSALVKAKNRGQFKPRTRSEANSLAKITKPQKHSLETKSKLSLIRVNSLNEKAFYSKRTNYHGITLDSSYEVIVAKSLDENNIKWIRPKPIKWSDDKIIRRYIPDFYLIDYNVYLDPKNNYLIVKDKRKIELVEKYNNVRIIVLDKNSLTWDKILNKILEV